MYDLCKSIQNAEGICLYLMSKHQLTDDQEERILRLLHCFQIRKLQPTIDKTIS